MSDYPKSKRDYNMKYEKENLKRIPLNVQKDFYESVKAHADELSESVNGFIKIAIQERIEKLDAEN